MKEKNPTGKSKYIERSTTYKGSMKKHKCNKYWYKIIAATKKLKDDKYDFKAENTWDRGIKI